MRYSFAKIGISASIRVQKSCISSANIALLQTHYKLSEFFADRDKLLRGKVRADKFEAKWRGVHIAGQEVFADTDAIFLRANAGDLKVENLYASVGGVE